MKKSYSSKSGLVIIVMGLCIQVVSGISSADDLRFFDVENATVKYKYDGSASGWSDFCISRWGNLTVERREVSRTVFGMKTTESKKIITEGPWITTVDYTKSSVIKTRNPMYESIKGQVKKKGGVKTGGDMIEAMGGTKTNKKGKFAGYPCNYWSLMGIESCMTKKGLTLHVNSNVMGIKNIQTATEVNIGKGCSKSAAKIPDGMTVKEVNLDQLMGGNKMTQGMPKDGGSNLPGGFDLNKLKDMFSK